MTDYILIVLAITIIFYLEHNRRTIKDWSETLDERQSALEDAQEMAYVVPYEKDGKNGHKKIVKKMYEDNEDIIYQEEDYKVYHKSKK
jgi:hypothetical protein